MNDFGKTNIIDLEHATAFPCQRLWYFSMEIWLWVSCCRSEQLSYSWKTYWYLNHCADDWIMQALFKTTLNVKTYWMTCTCILLKALTGHVWLLLKPSFLTSCFTLSQHMHKITILWKVLLDFSSKLQENNETRVAQICVLSDA